MSPGTCGGPVRIAVGRDLLGWHDRFLSALHESEAAGDGVTAELVDLDGSGWEHAVIKADAVLWKPSYMGPAASAQVIARISFIENHLRKRVVPNVASIWHFENKLAQSDLLSWAGIDTPRYFGGFELRQIREALANEVFPIIVKSPYGAGSSQVRMVRTRVEAEREAELTFSYQLWTLWRATHRNRTGAVLSASRHRWFWRELARRASGREPFGVMYWQQYLPGNSADLRVTVIGDRWAFAFWRRNRPNDFRASGSGLLDYETAIPLDVVEHCIGISRRFRFDSMAYDIIFRDDKPFILEISYGYLDSAIQRCAGHYEMMANGTLEFRAGAVWPQTLWVRWLVEGLLRRACEDAR